MITCDANQELTYNQPSTTQYEHTFDSVVSQEYAIGSATLSGLLYGCTRTIQAYQVFPFDSTIGTWSATAVADDAAFNTWMSISVDNAGAATVSIAASSNLVIPEKYDWDLSKDSIDVRLKILALAMTGNPASATDTL